MRFRLFVAALAATLGLCAPVEACWKARRAAASTSTSCASCSSQSASVATYQAAPVYQPITQAVYYPPAQPQTWATAHIPATPIVDPRATCAGGTCTAAAVPRYVQPTTIERTR
jgi:hypothetical protein